MKIKKLKNNNGGVFEGVFELRPQIFSDNRGYFYESFNKKNFTDIFGEIDFVQENHSFSSKNVIRGLHFQIEPNAQSKLVECLSGKIFDVVVDLRKKSPTFLNWGGIELSEKSHNQLWIEKGFAHGFYTLSDEAHVIYKVDYSWHPDSERSLIWNDPSIGIKWPDIKENIIISEKDLNGKSINQFDTMETF